MGISPGHLKALARDVWGFLLLVLRGNARAWLDSNEDLEGFDLWRKLMKGVRSRSEIRRPTLSAQLHKLDMMYGR